MGGLAKVYALRLCGPQGNIFASFIAQFVKAYLYGP
jgi:hypothetical protein